MNNPSSTSITRRKLLSDAMLLAAASSCAPSILSQAFINGHRWALTNGAISRTISFTPDSGLSTEELTALDPRFNFVSSTPRGFTSEFSFRCDDKFCSGTGSDFSLAGEPKQESSYRDSKVLTIPLRHKTLPIEVSVRYAVYPGQPSIRKHLVIRNTGTSPLHLSHLTIESLALALGPENEITLLTQYGAIPREIFYTGRSEDAGLFIANGRTGNGVAVISEVPGYMKRTEIGGWDNPDHVRLGVMYDTDIMPFERSLAPGESFTTACASLIPYRNSDAFNDPHWSVPSYTSRILERRINQQGPPWIYNTWEPFQRTINRDLAFELIDTAADMGIDVFTIDDGWQQEYGDNIVNTAAFPGGLQPTIERVESKGMRLGLWIPIAAIGNDTPTYRAHPEWAALDQEGKPKITGTAAGEKSVMCMASPYRDAAAARINDAITRFHLAYVKLDLTTVFNAYGEAPGCWAKGHYHGNWAESLNLIYEGISYVTHKVYDQHPDVLLDLTFELWGQKHIIDAGLLAAGDLDWMSNVDDNFPTSAGPLQARQLLYQRALSMPVESMLIGNIHAEQATIQERFATALGSAPLFLGDLRKLTPADRRWYHEKLAWFKNLRRTTPISESFFPLGSWQQTTPSAWDGFARLARTGSGIICLFRNKSESADVSIRLPQLPDAHYKLRSVITGNDLGAHTQSDWRTGIRISFPEHTPVEIIEITT
ncbi:MAG TPA: alpha-galactosidase [Terracidiphilus sp.]